MPLEQAILFAKLDIATSDDDFFILMRDGSYLKLSEAGLSKVGDVVAMSSNEVQRVVGLNDKEIAQVGRVVKKLGLSFETDVQDWVRYRATVPNIFKLRPPQGRRLPAGRESALLT